MGGRELGGQNVCVDDDLGWIGGRNGRGTNAGCGVFGLGGSSNGGGRRTCGTGGG